MNKPEPMTDGTATTFTTRPVSVAGMEQAMREIGLLPKQTDWVLVSPEGRVWKGDLPHVFSVLVAHHPLFKFGF